MKIDDSAYKVIILNWNACDETRQCVAHLLETGVSQQSVIMVDNGSTDGSEQRLRAKFPHIELIQTGSNLGYAKGNNIGIRRALEMGGEFILILNNDCRVDARSIGEMIDVLQRDSAVGMVSPKVFAEAGIISHAGSNFNWSDRYVTSGRGAGQQDTGQFDHLTEIDTATGDCLLVSRRLLEKVGLLDEGYFLYYEDTDWCLRARRSRFKIVYQPSAIAMHPGSLSTGGINRPVGAYYVLRNKLYFVQRYGTIPVKLQNWIHFVLSLFKNLITFASAKDRKVAKARLSALFDFARGRRGQNPAITNL